MFRPIQTTAPAEAPVSLAEAKKHVRVDHAVEDDYLTALVQAATDHLDGYTGLLGRCILDQEWRQDFEDWRYLHLPFPVNEVASVKYLDADEQEQTVSPGDYRIADLTGGPCIDFVPSWAKPSLADMPNPVRVTFTTGWASAEEVPSAIKAAILLHVGTLYANRETIADSVRPTGAYEALIRPYRRMSP